MYIWPYVYMALTKRTRLRLQETRLLLKLNACSRNKCGVGQGRALTLYRYNCSQRRCKKERTRRLRALNKLINYDLAPRAN